MICRRCGTRNPKNRENCRYCGARLQTQEALSAREAPPMLEVTAQEVSAEPIARPIRVSTRFAYGILTSSKRYRDLFLFLASFVLAALLLTLIGLEMPRVVTEALSATATANGQEAWRMAWSGVLVCGGLAAWLGFGVLVGFKMLRIRHVFQKRGRKLEPLPKH